MKRLIVLAGFALFTAAPALAPAADPKEAAGLPATWQGSWKGTLKITPVKGAAQKVAMELHALPTRDNKANTWRIVYGSGEKRQTRNYELAPVANKPGKFLLDEKNGIVLDCRLVGSVLYSQFKVNDNLILSRYERRGESLLVEMVSYNTRSPRASDVKGGDIKVESYTLLSVQTAELRRLPTK
jgi:hypothetical protein